MDRKRDQEFRQNKNKRTVEIVDETSLDHGMRINYQLRWLSQGVDVIDHHIQYRIFVIPIFVIFIPRYLHS